MKRAALIALTFVMATASSALSASPTDPGGSFWDDDGNVHESQIEAIGAAGITLGCGPDLYCPAEAITRGQMAAFLTRALNLEPSSTDYFSDDNTNIFESEINALAAARITLGCQPDSYCPDEPVSRGEMAAFLTRAFDYPSGPDAFIDDETSVFEADINALAAAGVTVGCDADQQQYCPRLDVRRDEMASFLARALKLAPLTVTERPSVTIAFTGDVLLHMPVNYAAASYGNQSGEAYDFRPMFSAIKPITSAADLAICHLEVPLSPTSTNLSGYPTFQGPAEITDALVDAGYDGCSLASNHSIDKGTTGALNTIQVMTNRGLGYDGTATSEADRLDHQVYTVDGVTVAHLSYTYGLNGLRLPSDKPWLVNLIDADTILADAERASDADLVVVSLHWGSEYTVDPTSAQLGLVQQLESSDHIDLIVGHHAHVVQPIGQYDDTYVIFGLGNSLSNQLWSRETTDGVIVTVDFAMRNETWVARTVTYTPTWVEAGSYRILPVGETLNSGTVSSSLRSQLIDSWNRTSERIERLGADVKASANP